MPEIEDAVLTPREKYARMRWWVGAAMIVAMPLSLPACSALDDPAPPVLADASPLAVDEPPSGGPIALAPSITGTFAAARRPTPIPLVATAAPVPAAPVEAVAIAAPPPAATPTVASAAPPPMTRAVATSAPPAIVAAVESALAEPSPCPPGEIAVMSKPDMAGIPVLLCRRSSLPR